MSRAFVREKDVDYLQVLPERPISQHPNDVTETGLTQIEHALAGASEAYIAAQASTDRAALAAAGRELRYWTSRRATARVVSEVRFGTAVTIMRDDGREQTFRIVGQDEADPSQGSISHVSPLAKAMFENVWATLSELAPTKPRFFRFNDHTFQRRQSAAAPGYAGRPVLRCAR